MYCYSCHSVFPSVVRRTGPPVSVRRQVMSISSNRHRTLAAGCPYGFPALAETMPNAGVTTRRNASVEEEADP